MIRTLRQPSQIVPSITFPLFLLAINTGGLDAATDLPGFPTDSYLTFALAIPFIQAGIFAVSGAGADLARDIETGFLNRLALTPMTRRRPGGRPARGRGGAGRPPGAGVHRRRAWPRAPPSRRAWRARW